VKATNLRWKEFSNKPRTTVTTATNNEWETGFHSWFSNINHSTGTGPSIQFAIGRHPRTLSDTRASAKSPLLPGFGSPTIQLRPRRPLHRLAVSNSPE
jgi:hypothetical protein